MLDRADEATKWFSKMKGEGFVPKIETCNSTLRSVEGKKKWLNKWKHLICQLRSYSFGCIRILH